MYIGYAWIWWCHLVVKIQTVWLYILSTVSSTACGAPCFKDTQEAEHDMCSNLLSSVVFACTLRIDTGDGA